MEPVSPKHIYDKFLRFAAQKAAATSNPADVAEGLMVSIRADATRFLRIDKPTGGGRFDLFLERLKSLDLLVFQPFLFELMARLEHRPEALDQAAAAIESYLVRRMICGMQTRSYGTLSLKLLRTLRDADGSDIADLIKGQLLALEGTDEWPSDEAFRREWTRRQFYGYFRRERVLMILRALEHHYQSRNGKAEPLMTFDWSQLQIEHILPQTWQPNWPLPPEVSPDERKANLQGIGNLTLVSQALNPSLSNAAWAGTDMKPGKRDALNKYAIMQMNRRLLDQFGEGWSDVAIKRRAEALFEDARVIWQR